MFLRSGGEGLCPCVCRLAGIASPPPVRAKAPAAALHPAASRSQRAVCVSLSPPAPAHFSRDPPATYTLGPMQSQLQRYENRTHFGCYYKNQMSIQKSCCQAPTLLFCAAPSISETLELKSFWGQMTFPTQGLFLLLRHLPFINCFCSVATQTKMRGRKPHRPQGRLSQGQAHCRETASCGEGQNPPVLLARTDLKADLIFATDLPS